VKKCPKCGMVHAESDFVCRRCRVDLLTGEPVAVSLPAPSIGSGAAAKALSSLAPKILNRASSAFEKGQKKVISLIPKRFTEEKPTAPTAAAQVNELIYCLQCGGEMKPATVRYFPGKTIYPFLGLAVVLIGLSFLWWGLLFTAALSIAGFFVFRSLKVNLWKCGDCSYELKRDKPKVSKSAENPTLKK
jgi:hypothetical protein